MSAFEQLEWFLVSESLPDDGITVMLDFDAGDPWPGWHEDGKWFQSNGMGGGVAVGGVAAWAHMPAGVAQ